MKNKSKSAVTIPTSRPPNMPANNAGDLIKPFNENKLFNVEIFLLIVISGCGILSILILSILFSK